MTPVLIASGARTLFYSIDIGTYSGVRDRALLGTMLYSFMRVVAVVGMNVENYYRQGKCWWLRLHEKGGKLHKVPAHHNAYNGTLETAHHIASHESLHTTKLYGRQQDEISLDAVARIPI